MSMFYGRWDNVNNKLTFGPTPKPEFDTLPAEEITHKGWYQIEPVNADDATFYEGFQETIGYEYQLDAANHKIIETRTLKFHDLEMVKAVLNSKINAYRNWYIDQYIIFGGVEFDTNPTSRDNLTGALTTINTQLMLAQTNPLYVPSAIPWTGANNATIYIEPDELISLTLKLAVFVSTCYQICRFHKDNVLSLDDAESIVTYPYDSFGWPDRDIGGFLVYLNPTPTPTVTPTVTPTPSGI